MSEDSLPQLELSLGQPLMAKPAVERKFRAYLVNPERVRKYALEIARRERFHEFNAVSVEFIQRMDAQLRNWIQEEVRRHPSRGKRLV